VLVPLFAFHLIYRIYQLVRFFMNDNTGTTWIIRTGWVVLAFALLLLVFKMRLYALKVQTRVIRLEEQIRLERVLPEPLRARISELEISQLVALRFAPEAELPELVKTALDKKLSNKEIKQAIKNWRPDYWRV
jgi:hypothetical protein